MKDKQLRVGPLNESEEFLPTAPPDLANFLPPLVAPLFEQPRISTPVEPAEMKRMKDELKDK